MVLVDVIILRPRCVLAAHLEVLARWTHLHLNAVFIFGVFIFCARAIQFISRLELVLILASLIIRLHGIVGDRVELIAASSGWLKGSLRPVL